MELYNEVILKEQLKTKWIGKNIIYMDEINSTNDFAKEQADQGCPQGTLVFADSQLKGRGTKGRNWESPSQKGIWFSFVLKPDLEPMEARGIGILAAYSVVKVLRNRYQIPAMIKWPNDVILNGRKLAGILTEMNADINNVFYSVVGIGININMKEFSKDVAGIATSLLMETGIEFSRIELLAEFLQQIEKDYEVYIRDKNLKSIINDYNHLMIHWKKEISLWMGPNEKKAVALGLCENGELKVKYENGTTGKIFTGEVSLRGMLNYI